MTRNLRWQLTVLLAAGALLGACKSETDGNEGGGGSFAPGAGTGGAGVAGATAGMGGSPAGTGGATAGAGAGGSGGSSAGSGGATGGSGGSTGGAGGAGSGGTGGTTAGSGGTGGSGGTTAGTGGTTGATAAAEEFCDEYETACGFDGTDYFNDRAECLEDFDAYIMSRKECMIMHLGNVMGMANPTQDYKNTHCPHAAGKREQCL